MIQRDNVGFGLMCLIWGVTWVATKAGLQTVPPLLFAGTRFVVAGLLIAAFVALRGESLRFARSDIARLLAVSLLLVTLSYGLLFWGMQFINSGSAALLNLSFTPIALLGFALVLRHETFDAARALVIALGVAGLAILFGPKLMDGSARSEAWGAAATVGAAIVYSWGSVLARPMIERRGPWIVSAMTMFLGGVMLLAASFALEPNAAEALRGGWGIAAWAGWAFLVIFGSLCGFTIYLRLLQRWGASKAGSFAFVSPIVAIAAGIAIYGEHVSAQEAIGMLVMLAAAFFAVRSKSATTAAKPVTSASCSTQVGVFQHRVRFSRP